MIIPIETAPITANRLVTPSSRYNDKRVIYYGEQRFLTFETYVRKEYKTAGNEKIMMITKGAEYRPDLVSFQVYGFPDAWWFIMEANGIKDIFDFKAGRTIFLPNLSL